MITTNISEKSEQMWVEITCGQQKFMIAICYGLSESRCSEEEIEEWYYELERQYAVNIEKPVIIIGDMNAHVGNDSMGIPENTNIISRNGTKLRDLNTRRQLTLMNASNKCKGLWTREDPNGTKSAIDLVLANEEMQPIIKRMKIDEEGEWKLSRYRKILGEQQEKQTDHNTIIVELNLSRGITTTKTTIWNLRNEEALNKFSKLTEDIEMRETWDGSGDPDTKYNRWERQLKETMYTCFKRITIKNKIGNPKINKAITQKKVIRKEIRELKKRKETREGVVVKAMEKILQEKVTEIADMIDEERKKVIENRMEKMMKGNKASCEIWKIRKNVTRKIDQRLAIENEEGKLITDKTEIKARYAQYYEELLKVRESDEDLIEIIEDNKEMFNNNMIIKTYDTTEMNKPFTTEELRTVIKNSKGGKSPGPDGITSELIKAAGKNLVESILKMMNWFWEYESLPKKLTAVKVKSIYKGKGATSDLRNHRGIFIGNTIQKHYDSLMSNRIKPQLEATGYTEYQAGGRCKRSIADHIFILRAILEHHLYINKELIMEYLDLIKCFDKLVLKNVMNDLWKAEVRGKIWRNIYTTNMKAEVTINTPVGATEQFCIGETVKQGSILAATMASLHTDGVNRMFKSGIGGAINYGEIRINNLIFQDDILKLAENKETMNDANVVYGIFAKINGMEYHESKSKYMTTGNDADIQLNKKGLEKAMEYKYLGDLITPDGGIDETIKTRKGAITGMTAELNQILEEIESTNKFKAIIRYYDSIITSRLLTNAETWNKITKRNLHDLEVIQATTIKRLLRLPNGTPTNGLRNELGILTVESQIIIKKLLFLHRVINMEDDKLVRRVMMKQKEQPGNHWYQGVEEIAASLDLPIEESALKEITRNQWRRRVVETIRKKENTQMEDWVRTSKKCREMKPNCQFKQYLEEMKPNEAMTILKARLGMTDVKANYRNKYVNITCSECGQVEDLKHLLTCKEDDEEIKEIARNLEEIIWKQAEDPKNQNHIKNLTSLSLLITQKLK